MKKLFDWCRNHILFLCSIFLLLFIPLYPKLPLVDIKNVWVYIRAEDFVVLSVVLVWMVLLIRNKVSLQTPLTVPILLFWIVGTIATIHGVLLVFPELANVFPNVALLSLFRRIEYMSLFFIAYAGMKDKKFVVPFILTIVLTFALVGLYALGQRYFSLPAYLTMNEEFAKGIPLQLSALSRVSSTFAGHYDLAAYIVLILPIISSLVFGVRNWILKGTLIGISGLGVFVLFLTVSRISFLALFASLALVVYFQKKKLLLYSLPVFVILGVFFLTSSSSLVDRFGSTVEQIDLLVDTTTGVPVGQVRIVPRSFFADKTVRQEQFTDMHKVNSSSPSASIVIPNEHLPDQMVLLAQSSALTGEELPSGTGYINLSLSPVIKRLPNFYYEKKPDPKTGKSDITVINGDYLLKKASAYDLSFTTRFQAEWPRAIGAFKRNIFFGSGYGSVSLAVDNSFLRMLGEVGVLGFLSFLIIFITVGIYIKRTIHDSQNEPVRSFIIGLSAGIVGLFVNGLFIDVFEASKVAFVLWLCIGGALAMLRLHERAGVKALDELKHVLTSNIAVIIGLFILTIILYSRMSSNYFVGDDFTWFAWASHCDGAVSTFSKCPLDLSRIAGYFVSSDGFFYRPGAKIYFQLMYAFFWLNQSVYHMVSLFLHFTVSAFVFLIAKRLLRTFLLPVVVASMFVVLSGFSEAIFWISATGFLFTAASMLASFYLFIQWSDTKKPFYFFACLFFLVCSLLFHELGIVTVLLFPLYQWAFSKDDSARSFAKNLWTRWLLLPVPIYLVIRFAAQSHWFNGDYSYNLLKLPLNVAGNMLGYLSLIIIGPLSSPIYVLLRSMLREQLLLSIIAVGVGIGISVFFVTKLRHRIQKESMRIPLFGFGFFVVTLLPFLGLGNISSRYAYVASIGILFVLVYTMRRTYEYLLSSGKSTANALLVLGLSLFFLVHIIQLQEVHGDWHEAGEKVQRFLISMDSVYTDRFTNDEMEFHFVDVPIKHGQAWVLPVGIPDALTLVFRNPKLKIYSWPTLQAAYGAVTHGSLYQKIFVFDNTGKVTVTEKPLITP